MGKTTQNNPKIKELRKARELSQEELAKRLGVSRQTVFLIETGQSDPSVSLACQLAQELQTSIEELFNISLPAYALRHAQGYSEAKEVSMNHLIPFSPFRELRDLREEIDRLFDESFTQLPAPSQGMQLGVPALNIHQTDKEVVIEAAVAGYKEDEIDVEVKDDVLTIRGERKQQEEDKKKGYLRREFAYGRFERSLSLPETVNSDDINAELNQGTLVITLPKTEPEKPKVKKVKIVKK